MLGLYDHEGTLHNLGGASNFSKARRLELIDELESYRDGARETHPWAEWAKADQERSQRMPGAQSRWNGGKDLSWEPLRIELDAEVKYDQLIVPIPQLISEIFAT